MTEYATTPSAIEEWKTQRNRTADWVSHFAVPGLPPTPEDDSDAEKRSLWDGAGWDPPSDCESATSVPPTMMLQYPDSRQEVISPTESHASNGNIRSHNGSRVAAVRAHAPVPSERKDEARTERARSPHPTETGPAPRSVRDTGVTPSQTSSIIMRRATAAPLPDSRSTSASGGAQSGSKRSVHSTSIPAVPLSTQSRALPSHRPSAAPSHQSTHITSHHPSHVSSHHPPSAFSTHTVTPLPPPGAAGSPPSTSSIHSRSISLADSRSSGPPEPIVIHPPTVSAHSATRPPLHSQTQSLGNGDVYPQMYVPSQNLTMQSVPTAAHVGLPPPSTATASLSYYSASRHSRAPDQHEQQTVERQSVAASHHTAHVEHNAQLPTPVSPYPHSTHSPFQQPMRASSNAAATGLGGDFVLVDAPSPGYEMEFEEKKGSLGSKSTASQRRERGSLLNVFGSGRQGSHSRSRSLPMAGVDTVHVDVGRGQQYMLSSPVQHHTPRSHHSQMNPYLTPVSPTSPFIPPDPTCGPHPPPIVYAPARHHRATHYSPPRIMYMPSSPRGQRQAPYDTRQLLHAHAQPYPTYPTYGGVVPAYAPGLKPNYEPEYAVGSGSVRRSRTAGEGIRDSGWSEGKREGSAVRLEREVHAAADSVPQENVHDQAPSPRSAHQGPVDAEEDASSADPITVQAPTAQSDATSVQTNLAGVGTVSARSRSRGGGGRTQSPDRHNLNGHEGERSRSRARGMAYSASAPQPHGSAPPHAAMMVPPASTMTTRDRGVRDTPYPTPPGSASEYQHQRHSRLALNGPAQHHRSSHSFNSPIDESHPGPSPGGLISRFRDFYHHPSHPAGARDKKDTSPNRGRARERQRKEARSNVKMPAQGRARSVDSQASHSSASTYYVLPTPGQKVRIIRTDGQTVTTTTSVSRNASGRGGWLKKAVTLRPKFMNRDAAPEPPAKSTVRAPDVISSRTPSGASSKSKSGARKSGNKLVRRNSTGSSALLAVSREASGAEARDVDIVIPGQ